MTIAKLARSSERTCRFTLIELLTVVAVIAIIASMLLPAFQQAKAKATETECAGRLKQVGMGIQIYADDSEGWFYVMRGGYRPNAVPSLTTDAPPIPEDVMQLFELPIRFCPSVENYSDEGQNPLISPRLIYNTPETMHWGYFHPTGDDEFVRRVFPDSNRANVYNSTYHPASTYDFYQPFREGNWSRTSAKYTSAIYYDTYDCQPLASDFITPNVMSHVGGNPKQRSPNWYTRSPGDTGLAMPRGANSVWADGHVQWNSYSTVSHYNDTIMAGAAPEGFAHQVPQAAGTAKFWTRQSQHTKK